MTYVKAATLADVPDGGALAVEVDGQEIALVRDGDDVYVDITTTLNGVTPQ